MEREGDRAADGENAPGKGKRGKRTMECGRKGPRIKEGEKGSDDRPS